MKFWEMLAIGLFVIIRPIELSAQIIDTLFPVKKNEKWGFINQNGEIKIPFQYDAALYWGSGKVGKVKKGKEWILLNKLGKEYSPHFNGTPRIFNDTLIILKNAEGEILCNEFGKQIIPEIFQNIIPNRNGFFAFKKYDFTGFANIKKGILIPPIYDEIIESSNNNYFLTKVCGKIGLYDINGIELLPAIYNYIDVMEDSLVKFGDGEANLIGIYNLKNQSIIIPALYDRFLSSNDNFIAFKNNTNNHLYIRKNNSFNENTFKSIFIKDEFAYVLSDTGEGLISAAGEFILLPNNEELVLQNELILGKKNGFYNFYSLEGKLLAKEQFLDVKSLDTPNWLALRSDSSWILLNKKLVILQEDLWNPTVLNSIIKCEKDGEMVRIELNEKGAIKVMDSFDNVVSFKVDGFRSLKTSSIKADPSINTATSETRWFYSAKNKKWGLKAPNGEIWISPRFDAIIENDKYGFTHVYKRCATKTICYFGEYYEISGFAGLVNYNTGEIIVEPEHVDVIVRGPKENPLLFTMNARLEFKYFNKNLESFSNRYSWVDESEQYPIRALLVGKIKEENSEVINSDQIVSKAIKVVQNPFVINRFRKYANENKKLIPINPVWTYFTGNKNPDKYFSLADKFTEQGTAIVKDSVTKKLGLINRNLSYTIAPAFDTIKNSFSEDYYTLVKNDTMYSVINDNEESEYFADVIDFRKSNGANAYFTYLEGNGFWTKNNGVKYLNKVTNILPFSDGLAAIKKNFKWGFVNTNGEIIVPCAYSKVIGFKNHKAAVKLKNIWKLIDLNGEIIDTLPFKDIKDWNNLIWANNGKEWRMLNFDFEIIEHLPPFISFSKDRKTGNLILYVGISGFLINQNNEIVYQGKLSKIKSIGNENYIVKKKFKSYLYSKSAGYKKLKRNLSPIQVNENRMWIKKNGLYYFADTTGKLVSKVGYERYLSYSNGIAAGKVKKEWKIFDSNGDVLFSTLNRPLYFGNANFILFRDINGFYAFYDKSGLRLNMPSFNNYKVLKNGNIWVNNLGKWGLLDAALEWIKYPQFDRVISINDELTAGVYHQNQGLCSLNGKKLIPVNYPFIKKENNGYYRAEAGNEVHWYKPNGVCIYGKTEKIGKSTAENLPKKD